jgi:hypothetical protein
MWAQLIRVRVKGDGDAATVADEARAAYAPVRAAEQPGSGLARTLVMQDQADPHQAYDLYDGPPEIVDLTVIEEWAD